MQLLKDSAGPEGWTWKSAFQFRAMNRVGETLTVWGRVTGKREAPHFGWIDMDTGIVNEAGVESTPGQAVVALPYRGGPPLPYPFVLRARGRASHLDNRRPSGTFVRLALTAEAPPHPMNHHLARTFALLRAMCMFAAGAAAQTAYPSKPIRIILPFPAGGSTDPLARLIAQKLGESWSQTVIVDNKPGAATVIGTQDLLKAPADGHTLLYTASTHVLNALLMQSLPYDSFKDFQPVAHIVRSEFVLVVHPSVPANNLQEFIALAKARPGAINYATSGNGNPNHLAGEYFAQTAGVKLTNVPYKGGGPAINDLLGGQVQAMFSVPTAVTGHVKAGKLKALAYTGSTPLPGLTVPGFEQAGLRGFEINSWNGIFVAAGTPRPIVDKLSAEIGRILALPDVKEKFAAQAQEPHFLNADQFTAMIAADRQKYGGIIKAANIKID